MIYLAVLFLAKMVDNALGTAKTILIQRDRPVMAGISICLSNMIYLSITKNLVQTDSNIALALVSVAAGVGCSLAVFVNNRFSREKTYINVIMSDDLDAMKDLRDFLRSNHITNVASDSYTKDWSRKTITITAYADTKDHSRLIDDYLNSSDRKFKRRIQKA